MNSAKPRAPSPRRPLVFTAALAVTVPMLVAGAASPSPADGSSHDPVLVGRAVLPVETYAGPPESGRFVIPGEGTRNGIDFPLAEQPVEGFSGIVDGRHRGEILAMPDNGFGGKANSVDFLIRAYHLRPDFKTADGGSGTVEVGSFISFRDPHHEIGFPIVNEGTEARLLTGGDIDPESLQRGRHGDLWVGDEFGPWILHFDSRGRLLDPPFPPPGNLMSPNNPFLVGPFTHPNSRGFEATAISPDGKYLYGALEGALLTDATTAPNRRVIYELAKGPQPRCCGSAGAITLFVSTAKIVLLVVSFIAMRSDRQGLQLAKLAWQKIVPPARKSGQSSGCPAGASDTLSEIAIPNGFWMTTANGHRSRTCIAEPVM